MITSNPIPVCSKQPISGEWTVTLNTEAIYKVALDTDAHCALDPVILAISTIEKVALNTEAIDTIALVTDAHCCALDTVARTTEAIDTVTLATGAIDMVALATAALIRVALAVRFETIDAEAIAKALKGAAGGRPLRLN